jgi:hypothetical protein
LNQRPPNYRFGALPSELPGSDLDAGAGFEPAPLAYETSMLDQTAIPRNNLAVTKGFEPSIFGVTGRRFDRTKLRHYWGDGRDLNPRR